jgi:hypothetical protein
LQSQVKASYFEPFYNYPVIAGKANVNIWGLANFQPIYEKNSGVTLDPTQIRKVNFVRRGHRSQVGTNWIKCYSIDMLIIGNDLCLYNIESVLFHTRHLLLLTVDGNF